MRYVMGKSRAKAEEEEKKKLKKERIRKALILAAIGLASAGGGVARLDQSGAGDIPDPQSV